MSSTLLLVATVFLWVTTRSSSSFVEITTGTCTLQDNSRWPIYESTGTDCATAGTYLGWSGTNTIKSGSISNTVRGCSTIFAAATGPVTPGVTVGANMYENSIETTVNCGDTISSATFGQVQATCACFVGPACEDATTNTNLPYSDCMCRPDYYVTNSDGLKIGRNKICSAGTHPYCYQQMRSSEGDGSQHTEQPICSSTLYPTCEYTDGTYENSQNCICGNRNNYIICSNNNGYYCKTDSFGTLYFATPIYTDFFLILDTDILTKIFFFIHSQILLLLPHVKAIHPVEVVAVEEVAVEVVAVEVAAVEEVAVEVVAVEEVAVEVVVALPETMTVLTGDCGLFCCYSVY